MVERSAWLDEFLEPEVINVPVEPEHDMDDLFGINHEHGSPLTRCPVAACGMFSDLVGRDVVMVSWGEVVDRAAYLCRHCGTCWTEEA